MSNPKQKATAVPDPQEQAKNAMPTEITARAYPVAGDDHVLANLTFDVNGCFAIRGARLVQGKNGPFVSMPQRQTRDGYQELVFPITKEMREVVNNMKEMAQKMEQSQQSASTAPAAPTMSM